MKAPLLLLSSVVSTRSPFRPPLRHSRGRGALLALLVVLSVLGAPSAWSATTLSFSYTGPAVPIPDGIDLSGTNPGTPAFASLVVSGFGASDLITNVIFKFDGVVTSTVGATTVGLDHNFVNDLKVSLISPNSTSVLMLDQVDGSGNNFAQMILDDTATTSVSTLTSSQAPFNGTWKPSNPLSGLNGGLANGTWQVKAQDFFNVDTGNIRLFTLTITADSPALPATHWLGGTDGLWTGNVNNWASDAAGTATTLTPTAADDITFSATGAANQTTTLGADFTIKSLTITDAAPVTINPGGAFSLTISGAAGTGIDVQAGAGLVTIGADVALAGSSDTIKVNNAAGLVINGGLSGTNVIKEGTGTLTLTGANSYTGGTTFTGGTLSVDAASRLGTGGLIFNGGTLKATDTFSLNLTTTINAGSATVDVDDTKTLTWQAGMTGAGGLTKTGLGTLTLTGANGFNGITEINGGTVTVDGGTASVGTSGANFLVGAGLGTSGTLQIQNGATLNARTFNIGFFGTGVLNLTGGQVIATSFVVGNGTGSNGTANISGGTLSASGSVRVGGFADGVLNLTGTGVVKVGATGNDTMDLSSGLNVIGTLNLGDGTGTAGELQAGGVSGASSMAKVNFNHTGTAYTFAPALVGGLAVEVKKGTTILTSNSNTYAGNTTVSGGILRLANTAGSATGTGNVEVKTGGTLGGTGTLSGSVTVLDGILAPGSSPGKLTIGTDLTLGSTSLLEFELGAPSGTAGVDSDLIAVGGALTLDGALNLTDFGGMGTGTYTILTYGGALTNSGLELGSVRPAGFSYAVDAASTPGSVLLHVDTSGLQFWDGPDTVGNGGIDGGAGTWNNSLNNWTNATGSVNTGWQDLIAVFSGSGNTVDVTANVTVGGMQFVSDGYVLSSSNGSTITLPCTDTEILVDPGITATISAQLTGPQGLQKLGLGTLVLTGTHDYDRDTVVSAGTLKLDGAAVTMGSNGDLFVTGQAGDAPLLQVLNGAAITGEDASLGYDVGETGKALVSGTDLSGTVPSSLLFDEDLRVGDWGSDSELRVEAGGYASALDIFIGHGLSSDVSYGADNRLIVTGAGTLVETQSFGTITVGGFGSGNLLSVEDGGTVMTDYLIVGGGDPSDPAFGSNNQVVVRGAGSLLDVSFDGLVVGGDGSGNALLVEDGAQVQTGYFILGGGEQFDTRLGSNNTATVRTNGELIVVDDITVGLDGSGNTFTVQEGGKAKSGYGIVGWGDDGKAPDPALGSNNKATVTGTGSLWEVEHDLYVGFAGSGNQLQVLAGGVVTAQTLTIGYGINGTPGFGGNNAVLVSGVGTQLLLSGVDLSACGCGSPMPSGVFDGASDLVIGQYGTGNSLTIADGGKVSVKNGTGIVTLAQEAGSGGTLNLGNGGAPGTLEAASVNGGAGTAKVNFNHDSTAFTFAPQLTGNLAVEVIAGTTIFNNPNTYTGGTTLTGGVLVANNTTGSATGTGDVVLNGGTLMGAGNISGTVRFNGAAVISPGNSPGTLNVGSLVLGPSSILNFELGTPGVVGGGINDLINVTGNLTLDGLLNIRDAGGFSAGTYRLINYGGALTNNGLDINSVPAGVNPGNLLLDVGTNGQVNLVYALTAGTVTVTTTDPATGQTTTTVLVTDFVPGQQYWDGSNSSANGVIDGGSGVWGNVRTNWTNVQGRLNGAWAGQTAVFRGAPGIVTLGSDVPFQQLIFQVSGYRIESPHGFRLYALGDAGIEVQTGRATLAAPTVIAGTFTKSGPGLLDLRSYLSAAATLITQGTLAVNGVLESPTVSVFHGATLMGSGLIIGNVFNHGTVAPGNSIGTLAIHGNYRQYGNGTLQIEVASPGHHDVLLVSGTAHLAGTLEIKSLGYDAEYGDQIAFLQAGKITGKFNRIEMPQPDLLRGRFLNAGQVGILLVAPTSYTLVAQTPNQHRLANALDQWIGIEEGDIGGVTLALDLLREEQYPQAFEAILPRYYETALSTAFELANNHGQLLHQQLSARRLTGRTQPAAPVPPAPSSKNAKAVAPQIQPDEDDLRWNVWLQGSGLFSSGGLSLTPEEDFESGTFTVGADYLLDEHVALGWFASYQEGWGDYESSGDLDLESARFGVYATFDHGGFYGNAALGFGQTDFDVQRPIQWATLERSTRSTPDALEFSGLLGGGYDFKVGGFTFGPQASLQYTRLEGDRFTEQGAGSLDLRVADFDAESLRSYLGARAAYTIRLNDRAALIPEVRIFWQHEYLEGGDDLNASLDGGAGPAFRYETENREEDSVFLGAGMNLVLAPRFTASLYYNTSLTDGSEAIHTVSLSAGYRF